MMNCVDDSFSYSVGWIDKFKKVLKSHKILGECESVDKELVKSERVYLKKLQAN
jgi:hypothetical protein